MGEKVHFWHGLKCHAARAACALVGENGAEIMTATPPYAGSPTKFRLFPFIPGLIRLFPPSPRLFPELISGAWWYLVWS
ncbi:hypothetical protein [Escherichia coli]|nr:hypothetical protein [Escherichia coli]SPX20557.1 Uncharacterised protein [Escherichia coli]